MFLDVGGLPSAGGTHQEAVLVATHQLVKQKGVAHCVHSGYNDVGILSISWDGGGVQQLPPGDPLELGLVKGEAIHCLPIWEDLGDLDRRCLQVKVGAVCLQQCLIANGLLYKQMLLSPTQGSLYATCLTCCIFTQHPCSVISYTPQCNVSIRWIGTVGSALAFFSQVETYTYKH